MTPLYPATNGTAPNTWRDNLIIWPLTPPLLLIAVVAIFVFEPFRRGA